LSETSRFQKEEEEYNPIVPQTQSNSSNREIQFSVCVEPPPLPKRTSKLSTPIPSTDEISDSDEEKDTFKGAFKVMFYFYFCKRGNL